MASRWARGPLLGVALVFAGLAPLVARQAVVSRISPRDQLKITVFGFETLSGDFQVDTDGSIKFPPLGLMKAGGQTSREVEAAISAGLASSGYAIRPPQVTVIIQPTATHTVTVTGEVKAPGTFTYAGEMTLYQALVKAGLPTPAAGDQILIAHETSVTSGANPPIEDIETKSYRELENGNRTHDVTLRDGDRVFVKKAGQVYIGGFVHTQGPVTVENSGITLRQALTLAGGLTERGSEKRIEILRKVNGKDERVKDVTLETIVKPGDTITVKARIF